MKRLVKHILAGAFMSATLLLTSQVYAQYGGGMGGGMGGYGGRMGGMNGMMGNTSSPRPMGPSASDMANRETDWMKTNLGLTKDQVKEVRKLNQTYASKQQTEVRALMSGDGPPSEATKQQMREVSMMINEEKQDKLKPLLTPEQWTTYVTKRDSLSKGRGPTGRMMGAKPN